MMRFWNLTSALSSAGNDSAGPVSPANSTPRILKSVFQTPADSSTRDKSDGGNSQVLSFSNSPSSIIEALEEPSTPIRGTESQISEASEAALPLPPPVPTALDVITPMEPLPPGTPGGPKDVLRRGILRDLGTPGSGRSVRFFSRDTYKTISPNASEETYESAVESKLVDASLFIAALAQPIPNDPSPTAQSFMSIDLARPPADMSNLLDSQPGQAMGGMWTFDESRAMMPSAAPDQSRGSPLRFLSLVQEETETSDIHSGLGDSPSMHRSMVSARTSASSAASRSSRTSTPRRRSMSAEEPEPENVQASTSVASSTGSRKSSPRQLSPSIGSPVAQVLSRAKTTSPRQRSMSIENPPVVQPSPSMMTHSPAVDERPSSAPPALVATDLVLSQGKDGLCESTQKLREQARHLITAQDEHLSIVKKQRDRYKALYKRASIVESKTVSPASVGKEAIDAKVEDDSVFLTQTGLPLQIKLSDTEAALQDALVRLELARRDADAAREQENRWRAMVEEMEREKQEEKEKEEPAVEQETQDSHLVEEIEALKEDYAKLEGAFQEHQLRNDDLMKQVWARDEQIAKMRRSQDEETASHQAALSDRDARISRMQDDVEEAGRVLEMQDSRLGERDEQIKQMSARVEESEQATKMADVKYADLEARLQSERHETAHWKAEIAKEIDQLDDEVAQLREQNEQALDQVQGKELQRQALAAELSTQADRFHQLERDLETTRKEVHDLRQRSALKDLEIAQLRRAKEKLQDDQEMLNIALDSKQQEVEMFKRRTARLSTAAAATPGSAAHGDESAIKQSVSGTVSRSRRAAGLTDSRATNFDHLLVSKPFPETPVGRPMLRSSVSGTSSSSTAAAMATTGNRKAPLRASRQANYA